MRLPLGGLPPLCLCLSISMSLSVRLSVSFSPDSDVRVVRSICLKGSSSARLYTQPRSVVSTDPCFFHRLQKESLYRLPIGGDRTLRFHRFLLISFLCLAELLFSLGFVPPSCTVFPVSTTSCTRRAYVCNESSTDSSTSLHNPNCSKYIGRSAGK